MKNGIRMEEECETKKKKGGRTQKKLHILHRIISTDKQTETSTKSESIFIECSNQEQSACYSINDMVYGQSSTKFKGY